MWLCSVLSTLSPRIYNYYERFTVSTFTISQLLCGQELLTKTTSSGKFACENCVSLSRFFCETRFRIIQDVPLYLERLRCDDNF